VGALKGTWKLLEQVAPTKGDAARVLNQLSHSMRTSILLVRSQALKVRVSRGDPPDSISKWVGSEVPPCKCSQTWGTPL
jgi:hypothetical protein